MNGLPRILVCIATSKGPSLVMDLSSGQRMKNADGSDRSMLVLSRELGHDIRSKVDVNEAYALFCNGPHSIIDKLVGHSDSYKLTLSGNIENGESWQLGVAVAHLLYSKKRLLRYSDNESLMRHLGRVAVDGPTSGEANGKQELLQVWWLTGKVLYDDGRYKVESVDLEKEKIANSIHLFRKFMDLGIPFTLFFPEVSKNTVEAQDNAFFRTHNITKNQIKYVSFLSELDSSVDNGNNISIHDKSEKSSGWIQRFKKWITEKWWHILLVIAAPIITVGSFIWVLFDLPPVWDCFRDNRLIILQMDRYSAKTDGLCPVEERLTTNKYDQTQEFLQDTASSTIPLESLCWLKIAASGNGKSIPKYMALTVTSESGSKIVYSKTSSHGTWLINTRPRDDDGDPDQEFFAQDGEYAFHFIHSPFPMDNPEAIREALLQGKDLPYCVKKAVFTRKFSFQPVTPR
ncbi:MAG: hypothetical protein HQL56_03590 [Magnetococcales bacterium]|nr:hypothetical protein [Magnetococcales bacterium]